jgi:hypothetical protein
MPIQPKRGLLVSRTWVQAVVIVFLFGFLILGPGTPCSQEMTCLNGRENPEAP